MVSGLQDKLKRHKERHTSTGCQFVLSDSISFLNSSDWRSVASQGSIFLSMEYLEAIEKYSPDNTQQRYAIAYENNQPLVVVVCQIAEITGGHLIQPDNRIKEKVAENYRERVLVCGNLVSSGLHGVAFAQCIDIERVWRIVAEVLYKIRRAEQLDGPIDFILIKDLKDTFFANSEILQRYSYRSIQTDPDMVLQLSKQIKSFDDYLMTLTSKYRSRAKKTIKSVESAGFRCEKLVVTAALDKQLHQLYRQVENKSEVRLATLPEGYFLALSQKLPNHFCCYGIRSEEKLVGFISIVKDSGTAIAYYVGVDYQVNEQTPVYFRLLQLVIDWAIEQNCYSISFGRTALEPKANLGAKPVDTYILARHRVPLVNFVVRKLFRNVPFDEAPERTAIKN